MRAICMDNNNTESLLEVGRIYQGKLLKGMDGEIRFEVESGDNKVKFFAWRFKMLDSKICEESDVDQNYIPKNIYYRHQQGITVVEWEDGTKTIVKTHEDKFFPEFGFAMALAKKIYGSRCEFMRIVNSGKFQTNKPVSKKENKK